VKSLRRRYETHFLWYELLFSAAATGIGVLIIEFVWGRDELFEVLDGARQALYIAIASIAGSLLGFTVATVSIILAFAESPRLRLVRESQHYETVYVVFFSAIKFLGITTGWALVALLWDRDSSPEVWVSYVALWTVVIAALRLYRCVWVLENVTRLAIRRPCLD
jgi:hypothetical protein